MGGVCVCGCVGGGCVCVWVCVGVCDACVHDCMGQLCLEDKQSIVCLCTGVQFHTNRSFTMKAVHTIS